MKNMVYCACTFAYVSLFLYALLSNSHVHQHSNQSDDYIPQVEHNTEVAIATY